ncbi:hypothetical protein BH20ACT11_BH20ACT11_15440 [soil metagenome]
MSRRSVQITLQPEVLSWARERCGLEIEGLAHKMNVKPKRVQEWEQSGQITMAQADKVARHTHTPLGFLYLPKPVDERLPISDFRTVGDRTLRRPSPELLDTVQLMQRRQSWMRDELVEKGNEPLEFVGSFSLNASPKDVAGDMRARLSLEGVMNFSSVALASGHGYSQYSKSVPERCFRRRVDVHRPIPCARPRRRSPTRARPA